MTVLLAITTHISVAVPIVLVTGVGSLMIMSTLMLSAQMVVPEWVKARGLAVTQMAFSGAISVRSLAWGAVADQLGIPWTS